MERVEAEPFTDGGNDAVARLPGRNSPGVLIQGDTLSTRNRPPTMRAWKQMENCWRSLSS
ncbi:DUF6959 family protein [Streptomyces echinatus]|uniref:DUF6959 family protein n=1 Tax=Streptomyces echinatus TaxID=67293 RepID=UPI0037A1064D